MRTEIATVTERERDIAFNATRIKLYIKAVIEKKSKAADQKTNKQSETRQRKIRNALFYLFIYYDEGPPRKRDEHQ